MFSSESEHVQTFCERERESSDAKSSLRRGNACARLAVSFPRESPHFLSFSALRSRLKKIRDGKQRMQKLREEMRGLRDLDKSERFLSSKQRSELAPFFGKHHSQNVLPHLAV